MISLEQNDEWTPDEVRRRLGQESFPERSVFDVNADSVEYYMVAESPPRAETPQFHQCSPQHNMPFRRRYIE
jgi:hypothetical protein